MLGPPFTFERNTLGSNGGFLLRFIAGLPYRVGYPSRWSMVRGLTRRQCQTHDGSGAAALPCDLAAELARKDIDQPAAEPGIGSSRIAPLPVVGDRQAKLSRYTF